MGDAVESVRYSGARRCREDRTTGELLSAPAREVLEAQILLLGETGAQGAAGRMASAGVVAANVLRHRGPGSRCRSYCARHGSDSRRKRPAFFAGGDRNAAERSAVSGGRRSSLDRRSISRRTARTLRVDAARIDALVNLTGELTVAKNAIGHAAKLAQEGDPALASMLKDRYAVLDRLVGELQRSVLGMRVLPLRHVFQRFPRLLREISSDLGKPASLVDRRRRDGGGQSHRRDAVRAAAACAEKCHGSRHRRCRDARRASQAGRCNHPPARGPARRACRRGSERRRGGNRRGEDSPGGAGTQLLPPTKSLRAMSDEEVDQHDLRAGIFDRGRSHRLVGAGRRDGRGSHCGGTAGGRSASRAAPGRARQYGSRFPSAS